MNLLNPKYEIPSRKTCKKKERGNLGEVGKLDDLSITHDAWTLRALAQLLAII